jgi:WD40 repeat protein
VDDVGAPDPAVTSIGWPGSETGQQRAALIGHAGAVESVAVAADGTWLASGDHGVRIWDLATGQQRAALPDRFLVTSVAIAPDGSWLAIASKDSTVRIWDPATGDICALMRVDGPLGDCAWNPSGDLLAVAGEAGLYLFTFKS